MARAVGSGTTSGGGELVTTPKQSLDWTPVMVTAANENKLPHLTNEPAPPVAALFDKVVPIIPVSAPMDMAASVFHMTCAVSVSLFTPLTSKKLLAPRVNVSVILKSQNGLFTPLPSKIIVAPAPVVSAVPSYTPGRKV